jgi:hypothetical protein
LTDASSPPLLSVKKDPAVLSFLVIELFCLLVLVSPWGTVRAIVTPWYLLVLPGAALLLLLQKEVKGLVEFILKSFLASVLITFGARTAVWYLKVDVQVFNWGIAVWILVCLLVALMRGRTSPETESVRFSRIELAVVILSMSVFAALSLVMLNSPYTPAPDELKYMLEGRSLNLFSAFRFGASNKAGLVNFVDSRPLWSTTISSFLAVSSASVFSSRLIEVFFLSMTTLAAFMLSTLLASEKVGLIAACLTFSTPALVIWSSTVILDFAFAAFCFLGYCFFIRSVRSEDGRLSGISFSFVPFAALSFLFAFLTKPGDLTVFVFAYLGFCYIVWKSRYRWKRLTLAAAIGLPAAYLALDFVYNLCTYVVPNSTVHDLLLPILPYSFFERFFVLYHPSAGFSSLVSASSTNLLSLAQGMYVALLSPYLITYAVVFLFLAGVISTIRRNQGIGRFNLVMTLSILLFGGFVSTLLLYLSEIPRNGLFIYPFMVCLAAVGLYNSLKGRVAVWLVACALILGAVYYLESTMIKTGGITVGVVPGQNQLSSSLLSAGLALGLGLIAWKAIQGSRIGRRIEESPRLARPYRYSAAIAVGLIVIISLSQASALAQTSPVLSQSSFSPLEAWLNTHIRDGDVIVTNGNSTLLSLSNDSLLQLIHDGGVKVLQAPETQPELLEWTLGRSYQYLVVFKNPEYTFTDSYASVNYRFVAQVSSYVMRSALVDVYKPS